MANEVYVNTSNSARLQEVNYSYSLPTTRSISKWRFSAIVSDLDLPGEIIWRTYRGRANCEHRIKALKYDFAADSLAMQDVWATEAAMNTVMLAYNLMGLPPFHQLRLLEVFMENLGSMQINKDRSWDQLVLQTSDFWNLDWYGDWRQVSN